ncbi:TonB-dependent receptor domain-containing protein [Parabacteroides johnsonii]|uniref:TonB-dependent receptor domain-containing protein n=1 Tax=Parabacteroides johnsonii TaxID=387661 RepID=UPI0016523F49
MKYRLNDKRSYLTADASFGQYNYYFDYTGQEVTNFFHPDGTRVVNYPGDRVLQTMQRRWLNHVKGVFYLGDNHILSAGIEHQHDYLKSPYRLERGKASVYTLASYAQDEWSITNRLNLTLGYRFVHHKEFGQKFTPKISAKYSLGDFNLRATYSYGFKAPTLKELYQNYITVIMGPLKAYYGNGKFQATVTGYYNRIHNMIALTVVPTSSEDKFLEVEETMKYNNLQPSDITISLAPFMSIAGDHAHNDLWGIEDGDDFSEATPGADACWRLKLLKMGFKIATDESHNGDVDKCTINGLGDYASIRKIWVDHLKTIYNNADEWQTGEDYQ